MAGESRNEQTKQPKQLCTKCNKALVSIGHARTNGKCHRDWCTRTMHKKCWKEAMEELRWKTQLEQ